MEQTNDTSPDELMNDFQGRSLKSIIIFTLIVHAVIILGTSIPFILKSFTGSSSEGMSDEEKKQAAVQELQASIQKIAEEKGMSAQELSEMFTGGNRPKLPVKEANSEPVADTTTPPADQPNEPESAIEKEINKVEKGPEVPPVQEEEVDLFK